MTDFNEVKSKITSIRYSRYLGASTLVVMGSNISIGVGIFLLIGPILKIMGQQTPMAYVLTLLFFIPIVLTLTERMPIIQDVGGIYDLTRARENVRLGFINGWMLLGGLFGLGTLLTLGAVEYVNYLLIQLFETSFSGQLMAVFVVLLIAVNQYLGTHAEWRKRRLLVVAAGFFLLVLLFLAMVKPQPGMMGFVWLPTTNEIEAVPYLAIGLWGVYFILERSDQLRSSRQNALSSLLAPVVILAGLGVATAMVLLRYPTLITNSPTPLLVLAQSYHPLLALILVVLVALMMIVGLNQVFTSVFLLAQEMTDDGLLPPWLMAVRGKRDVPIRPLLILTLLIVLTAVVSTTNIVATMASACLLTALIAIHSQDITEKVAHLPEDRKLKLPLHPLFPIVVIVICLTLIFVQPYQALLWPLVWVLAGVVLYLLYARQATIAKLQEDVVVKEAQPERIKAAYRIMVCLSRTETAVSLIQAGAAIAKGEHGDLLVLRVLDAPEQTPDKQETARNLLTELEALIQKADVDSSVVVYPLIRIAPSVSAGILSTAWEESVNSIMVGWPRAQETPHAIAQEGTIEMIVRRASQEIIVLHGELPEAVHSVLVPMTSEAHEVRAMKLGQAIKQSANDTVMAIQPVRERLTEAMEASLTAQMQQQINKLDDTQGISGQVIQIANAKDAFVRASEQYDLMIVGMSDEGFLATTTFGGGPVELAEDASAPTLLIKSAERQERFFIRRAWEEITDWLPSVDIRQQATVYLGMRRDAKATVDFYILIFLATTIAYYGLLQNSTAVIIGAMLIAPLMSPILAMAHGIVQGNVKLLKQAANTTFNGVLLAIGTAVVFSFGLTAFKFPIPATSEILGRTQPNILDLMVALASGAAAAYAISRKEVASALPGVAIAAALVPPLAVVGYGIGSIQFDYAAGALLLFITNLAAIVLAGAVTFLALGFRPPTRAERGEQTRYGLQMALVAMLIISIPLLLTTVVTNRKTTTIATIEQLIENFWLPTQAQVEIIGVDRERSTYIADFEVFDFKGAITTNDIVALQREIEQEIGEDVILRSVILDGQLDIVDGFTEPIPDVVLTPTFTPTLTATLTMTPVPTQDLPLPDPTATEYVPAITIEPTFDPNPPTETPEPEETATPILPTQAPNPSATPEEPPTPEGTATPEGTTTPEETATPEGTPTPEETATPEETVTPEDTATPEESPTPEATPTPDDPATDTPEPPTAEPPTAMPTEEVVPPLPPIDTPEP